MADEQENETTETPEAEAEQVADAPQEAAESAEAPAEEPAAEAAEEPAAERACRRGRPPRGACRGARCRGARCRGARRPPPMRRRPRSPPSELLAEGAPPPRPLGAQRRGPPDALSRGASRRAHRNSAATRPSAAARAACRNAPKPPSAAPREPAPEPLPPVHAPVEGTRRVRQGIVVSDKAEKTITVRIDVARRHRRYEKIVRSSSTVHAHDENNDAHEGDVVRVIESRPLSRTKRWALVDVVERAR